MSLLANSAHAQVQGKLERSRDPRRDDGHVPNRSMLLRCKRKEADLFSRVFWWGLSRGEGMRNDVGGEFPSKYLNST
jgi:hypothetical protein